jgi:hypothetical protein
MAVNIWFGCLVGLLLLGFFGLECVCLVFVLFVILFRMRGVFFLGYVCDRCVYIFGGF